MQTNLYQAMLFNVIGIRLRMVRFGMRQFFSVRICLALFAWAQCGALFAQVDPNSQFVATEGFLYRTEIGVLTDYRAVAFMIREGGVPSLVYILPRIISGLLSQTEWKSMQKTRTGRRC